MNEPSTTPEPRFAIGDKVQTPYDQVGWVIDPDDPVSGQNLKGYRPPEEDGPWYFLHIERSTSEFEHLRQLQDADGSHPYGPGKSLGQWWPESKLTLVSQEATAL